MALFVMSLSVKKGHIYDTVRFHACTIVVYILRCRRSPCGRDASFHSLKVTAMAQSQAFQSEDHWSFKLYRSYDQFEQNKISLLLHRRIEIGFAT